MTTIQQAATSIQRKTGNTTLDLVSGRSLDVQLHNALEGTGLTVDRFKRVVLTSMRQNPKLQACSQASFLGAMMTSAQLGLEPNTPMGLAYLIPYKTECTFILGYKGLVELARRSGRISQVMAHAVYEGDEFVFQLGLKPDIHHIPSGEDREDPKRLTHVYAYARFTDGSDPVFVVLTKKKIETFRKRSMAGNGGPWATDYEAMAMKTAVRRLATWLPLSPQMAGAIHADEGKAMYDVASGDVTVIPQYELDPPSEDVKEPIVAPATVVDPYASEGGLADSEVS